MNHPAHGAAQAGFPERVGRYEVLLPIGTGGMATVYLARAAVVPGVKRDFALKLMHPHIRSDPELSSQLMQEAKLAARIHHPNVVQVVEVADDPMGMFLVLDYVEGDALSGLLSAARARGELIPSRIAGRILTDALIGLHAAHELKDDAGNSLNLVHRDFSPHNILVGTDGLSRLTDFGIAKAAGDNATTTGVLKGKVSYMAPEYALGREPDKRADVWSAGVVLWELLTGRRLFRVKNDVAALIKLVSQAPARIEDVVPDVPRPVAAVVREVLQRDPAMRCPDALTFCTRLTEAWAAYGGLAERLEVADYVSKQAEETLRRRRDEVSSISARRKEGSPAPVQPVTQAEPELTEELTSLQQVMPSRRRRVAVSVGGFLLIAGAIVTGVYVIRGAAEVAESTATSTPVASRSVVIRASEPITKLRVGRRTVDVPEPKREIEVALLPSEVSELVVEAISASGQSVQRTLQPGEGSLTLVFEVVDAAPPASVAPVVSASPARRSSPPRKPKENRPGLAPTPFHR